MVNRVTFLAQISTLSYIVKNFKLGFLKKGSPKKFKTQDLKWSLSTCKKLLKHFFSDIFLFQDISQDKCDLSNEGALAPPVFYEIVHKYLFQDEKIAPQFLVIKNSTV